MKPLNLITPEDIKDLSVTACSCFYKDQEDRFEILKGNKESITEGSMYFYEDHLTALISYNYYRNHTDYKVVLLYDMGQYSIGNNDKTYDNDQYVIAIDKPFKIKL